MNNHHDVSIKEVGDKFDLTIDGIRLNGVRGYKLENLNERLGNGGTTEVTVTFLAAKVSYEFEMSEHGADAVAPIWDSGFIEVSHAPDEPELGS